MEGNNRETRKINPRAKANIFSKIVFWYAWDLLKKGYKKELEDDDLYDVLPDYESSFISNQIEKHWDLCKKGKLPMFIVFWKMFGRNYILLGLTQTVLILFDVLCPFIIGKIVFLCLPEHKEGHMSELVLYCVGLVSLNGLITIYRQYYYFIVEEFGIKFRVAICALLYRKFLKLPKCHVGKVSFGQITNLITKDINGFCDFFFNFNNAWVGLISTTIIFVNMFEKIGLPALVAICAFAVFIPFQVCTGIGMAVLKIGTSKKTDNRISKLQDVLSTIRATKMYVWETYREKIIKKARK